MAFQLVAPDKLLPTEVTAVRFLLGVDRLDVALKVVIPPKALATEVTGEGFLSRVGALMPLQVDVLGE